MKNFALRFAGRLLPIPPGHYLIGRSTECGILLDESTVSRRHARLHATGDQMSIQDLGSANGLFVNGKRVLGERIVDPGDQLLFGSFAVEVVLPDAMLERPTLLPPRDHGARPSSDPGPDTEQDSDAGSTSQCNVLSLFGEVADRFMRTGQVDGAERLLGPRLTGVLVDARRGHACDAETFSVATAWAVKFARARSDGAWLDFAFELGAATGRVPDLELVNDMHGLVRTLPVQVSPIRNYVETLEAKSDFSPAERFVLQRLRGLQGVVLSR